ncbi:MAG TPA: hypothetical protein EYQ50_01975 [Verrucomicrobiales bacterium]|nr:hypothetical protein [Verrucomicrobiales bacterium]
MKLSQRLFTAFCLLVFCLDFFGQGTSITRIVTSSGGVITSSSPLITTSSSPPGMDPAMAARYGIAMPSGVTARGPIQQPGSPGAGPQPEITLEKQRIQEFVKLKFDRRQSIILKAIAKARQEESKKKESTESDTEDTESKSVAENEKPEDAQEAIADEEIESTSSEKSESESKSDTDAEKEKEEEPKLTEAELKQKKAAEEAKKAAEKTAEITKQVREELEAFKKDVTLGRWSSVKKYLALFSRKDNDTDADRAYLHLLTGLQSVPRVIPKPPVPGMPPQPPVPQKFAEKHVLYPDDVLALADASPVKLEKTELTMLGSMLREALSKGNLIHVFIEKLKKGTEKLGGESSENRQAAAMLLVFAGRQIEAGEFLPTPEEAEKTKDRKSLNLLARYYMALFDKEKESHILEKAWAVTQAVLGDQKAETAEKEEALERALDLAPRIDEELGEAWLTESFTEQPLRGIEILTTIGSLTSKNRGNRNSSVRLKKLQLQNRTVQALIGHSPERAREWEVTLNLLALNWLREADQSYRLDQSSSRGPQMQFDPFGNIFYSNYSRFNRGGNQPQPIPSGELLDIHPGKSWLELVDSGLRPKFWMVSAQLFLKVNEEDNAFPYIEQLAATHPDEALDLANEFIRIWTNNHDPNSNRNRRSMYMYVYGYNRRAEGIPLTRSKQARNLSQLGGWIERLKALPIGELDQTLLAKAFTTTHSVAEVYRLEDIQKVFGDMETLKPKTLAGMIQTMRQNLASVWRKPDVQKKSQTKSKDKEIQAEVFRGYRVAVEVLEQGLEKHPEHWAMQLAKAAIMFDENTYRYELTKDSQFSARRQAAFHEFQKAAKFYASALTDLPEDEESAQVYEIWFYASLGATDLAGLRDFHQPELQQPELIRKAIMDLSGEGAERHLARFSNSLATRITSVKSELKHRYLRAGLQIAGEHKKANEARKLYQYYDDLITEIKLDATIDGSDRVGHGESFGLFVNIRHTKEVERESGGFNKYLQNQNNAGYFFNYGRPLVNYRDDFEEAARQKLEDDFEVISVTFHTDKIQSRGDPESGWRLTPYAYILMKARGPEVDAIPSMQMDLDFMDTSGSVVLPIESAKIPIDASTENGDLRPVQNLKITQMLDERRADEGILALEIKATGDGLIPPLDEIAALEFEGFDVTKEEDQGVSIFQMNAESEKNAAVSERLWVVELRNKADQKSLPEEFEFPEISHETSEVIYQRYEDADLVEVSAQINLLEKYGEPGFPWSMVFSLFAALIVSGGFYVTLKNSNVAPEDTTTRFQVPEKIDAFSVIGLLEKIREECSLDEKQSRELGLTLNNMEKKFFGPTKTRSKVDLREIAEEWVKKTA